MRAALLLTVLLSGCIVVVPSDDSCSVDTDCASSEFCNAGDCEDSLNRDWQFTVEQGFVGLTFPDGTPWDFDGTDPELFVEFGFEGQDVCTTSVVLNQREPVWSEFCTFFFDPNGLLFLDLWEADDGSDQFVNGWEWPTAASLDDLIRDRGILLSLLDGTGTVEVFFRVD